MKSSIVAPNRWKRLLNESSESRNHNSKLTNRTSTSRRTDERDVTSSLLKILLGQVVPQAGTVKRADQAKIGYLSQHITFDESHRLIEAFRDRIAVDEGKARHLLAQFLFYGPSVFKPVSNLTKSGENSPSSKRLGVYPGVGGG